MLILDQSFYLTYYLTIYYLVHLSTKTYQNFVTPCWTENKKIKIDIKQIAS